MLLTLLNNPLLGQYKLSDLTSPDKYGISSDSLNKMNAHFHSIVDDNKLAGIQIAVIRKGKLIHFNSYGNSNIEKKELLDEKSIFRIFSMTKPIVSVALMKLYEEGKFKLEDHLADYIPSFKESKIFKDSTLVPVKQPIRIIDLLRHTSGYSYGNRENSLLNDYYSKADLHASKNNKEYCEKISKIPLEFEPGTNWKYGQSTNIIGHLIEVLSGQSLDQYLHDSILKPLNMNDTHFQLPKDKIDRFTEGYRWSEENGLHHAESAQNNRYTNEVTLLNGGGGLVSTTFDYLQFCQMILNKGQFNGKRILKETTINLMLSDQLEATRNYQNQKLNLPLGEASFGLGFAIRGKNHNALDKVFGWGGAAGTYFKIDMEHEMAYVMMIQLSPHRHLELRRQIQEFMNASIIY